MARTRVGLPGIPARDDPEHAIALLLERGYDACEIDFEGGFWMDYPWAEKLGERAQVLLGRRRARPQRRDRCGLRRRGRRLPPRLPARPRARGRHLVRRRA